MKKLNTLLKTLVSLGILFFLLYSIGFGEVYNTFLTFNMLYLPLFVAAYLLNVVAGSANLAIIFHGVDMRINFIRLMIEYTRSWVVSHLLPGKLGNLPLVFFLRKEIPVAKSAVAVFIDALLTYGVVVVIFSLAWFNFFSFESGVRIILVFFAAGLILLGLLSKKGRFLISKYFLRRYAVKFKGFSKDLVHFLRVKKKLLSLNFLITLVKVNLNALPNLLAFMALGVQMPYSYVFLIYVITLVASGIPISISGLGVRESVGVFLYSQIGVSPEISAVMLLSVTLINYALVFISFWVVDYTKKFQDAS